MQQTAAWQQTENLYECVTGNFFTHQGIIQKDSWPSLSWSEQVSQSVELKQSRIS